MTTPLRIGIVGAGWLGVPLGAALVHAGHAVVGTTRSPERESAIAAAGMTPLRLDLDADALPPAPGLDVLVLDVPPGRRDPDVEARYARWMERALAWARHAGDPHVLFVSSTSVYGDASGTVDGRTPVAPTTASGRALVAAEARVREAARAATVVRPGGLYGPGRVPGRFLAGRTDVADPEAPVNLIHQDDLVALLCAVIERGLWGRTYAAAAPGHPSRRAFYTAAARALELEPPAFAEGGAAGKRVDASRLAADAGHTWLHPDPLAAL